MNEQVKKVLEVARGEVGVREIGNSNTGKRVKEYQAATTLGGSGWPWCAAYCAWVIEKALGKQLAREVWYPSASCDEILNWARRKSIISSTPSVGSAGLVMASKNDATHIFLVGEVDSSFCVTYEGNTNAGGSRNGNGVYKRTRSFSSRYLYVHWHRLLDATVTPVSIPTYDLYFGAQKVSEMPLYDGRSYVEAWKWAQWFKQELGWNNEAQSVTFSGREVLAQPKLIPDKSGVNRALVPVMAAVTATPGIMADVDTKARRVTILRK